MRVLVTGHNGYIGSVMVPILSAAGHTVSGLDSFFFEGYAFTADLAAVATARKDIRDVRPSDLEGSDAVIHLAWISDDPDTSPRITTIGEINHEGAVHLARSAREAGVSRFLFASSCSVYGMGPESAPLSEDAPVRPVTAGGISKVRAEEEILRLADTRFSPVIMRSATAYGVSPRLRIDGVLNNLVCWAHSTGQIRINSDGTPWRPLVHVEDIAHAFAAALAARTEAIHAQVFNVGANSENYQISELAEIVRGAVPGSTIDYLPELHRPQLSYRVDFGKMSRTFAEFRPRWNASFGAKDLYASLQEPGVALENFHGRRYNRSAQLRHLIQTGTVDAQLRFRPGTLAASQG